MARTKVNLTLDQEVIKEARQLGLNMSRLADEAIAEASRLERNKRWREENKNSIEQYNQEVEQNGLPLQKYRSF